MVEDNALNKTSVPLKVHRTHTTEKWKENKSW